MMAADRWSKDELQAKIEAHEPARAAGMPPASRDDAGRGGLSKRKRAAGMPPASRQRAAAPREREAPSSNGDAPELKAGARRIVETLARHHPMRMTRAQLGTLAKFKVTGGTFQTYWGQIKRAGLATEARGEIAITDAGLDFAGVNPGNPLTAEEILEQWRSALKKGAREMLDVLVDVYPTALHRDDLAQEVGMTASGGTFQTYLGTLRRNGLVDVDASGVVANETLFLAS